MTGLPDNFDLAQCERFLREVGALQSPVLPIAEAALALASFDRPRVALARYGKHLTALAQDVGRRAAGAGELETRATALNEIILLKHGYSGDELTYDDLQNANLMRVIDRRKGLPVALGILYLGAARAQGWDAVGLGFPGHFLIRLSDGAGRLILDPFHGGRTLDAVALRELLKAIAGQEVELAPEHYAPVADREVLLRLQNNLKSRLIQAQRHEEALRVVETMRMLSPDLAELSREAGILQAKLGNMRAAVKSIEEFIARTPEGSARHEAAIVLQQLKSKLN
ncbi:MAG TPA: transglutaminase-like domain-containing protein [Stellaceae bacterium]|nr:transglutaminase-like domain-containing protein [Stellaceae bacterium]